MIVFTSGHVMCVVGTDRVGMKIAKWASADPDFVCLTFYYYMHGNGSSSLMVFHDDGSYLKGDLSMHIWHESYDQRDLWRNQSITLSNILAYPLVFSATSNDHFHVAVDDISITDGRCLEPTGNYNFAYV
jgi:hypothetical protein